MTARSEPREGPLSERRRDQRAPMMKAVDELSSAPPGRLVAALQAVLDVHGAVDAVQYLGSRQIPRSVCAGCGSDDGNWQAWPCPTVRAITAAIKAEQPTADDDARVASALLGTGTTQDGAS